MSYEGWKYKIEKELRKLELDEKGDKNKFIPLYREQIEKYDILYDIELKRVLKLISLTKDKNALKFLREWLKDFKDSLFSDYLERDEELSELFTKGRNNLENIMYNKKK